MILCVALRRPLRELAYFSDLDSRGVACVRAFSGPVQSLGRFFYAVELYCFLS